MHGIESLNKGRGITPGYTDASAATATPVPLAQQRPRYHPRLHSRDRLVSAVVLLRSTKAEVSPPATPDQPSRWLCRSCRSTKAEVSPPATHIAGRHPERRQARSTKAEVSPPATRCNRCWQLASVPSLNKGRGITPGYTRGPQLPRAEPVSAQQRPRYHPRLHIRLLAGSYEGQHRSTKAEVSPPATRLMATLHLTEFINAQQRPRYHPRLHTDRPAG